jgi:two-component system NtrC family sensor kinase
MTPVPVNEFERIKALYQLQILDSLSESSYDGLTKFAAQICDCPYSLISFVDRDRQWFKSSHQLSVRQMAREGGFCAYAILEDHFFLVSDAAKDKRFKNHPFVIGPPHIRFYAAAPVIIGNGLNVGVICVMDTKPRNFDSKQIEALKNLAAMVASLLSHRKMSHELKGLSQFQKEGEKAIVHAAQMVALAEAAGGLAHEINNPLGIIRLGLECLQRDLSVSKEKEEQIAKHFQRIESALDRVAKITHSLSTYSGDSRKADPELVRVTEIIEDTLLYCSGRLKESNIQLKLKPLEVELALECKPVQISQVLLNLINNSADALKGVSEKEIQISVKDKIHFLEIAVKDSGKGIPLHLQDQVFQPFFTTKKIREGTGLGLSICRRIVESHGGTLEIDPLQSQTCFVMRIPKKQRMAA